jgi:polyphosphate glucokinase
MKILVMDVGGSHVKLRVSGKDEVRKVLSGPTMTARQMVAGVKEATKGWKFDAVSMGYPGPVANNKILKEPVNLGKGWVNYDFSVLNKPYKIINDAAMQALGSYEGGRMLFLGLGTGLGTTLIVDGVIVALELGHLPYKKDKSFEDYVGTAGLKQHGCRKWQMMVFDVVAQLKAAFVADYVVLGGGNVKKLVEMPPGARPGDNFNAFIGGERLWDKKK